LRTNRSIPNGNPDSIIRDNIEETRVLVGVAISGDRNVIRNEDEKSMAM
jgi:hypothetical protein